MEKSSDTIYGRNWRVDDVGPHPCETSRSMTQNNSDPVVINALQNDRRTQVNSIRGIYLFYNIYLFIHFPLEC